MPTRTFRTRRVIRAALMGVGLFVVSAPVCPAQIASSVPLVDDVGPVARLEDQLVNQLHATLPSQKAYLRHIVTLVDQDRLEARLVIAVQRYAMRRNPRYPFPFFERALNFQARKEGIMLPELIHFQNAAEPSPEAFN